MGTPSALPLTLGSITPKYVHAVKLPVRTYRHGVSPRRQGPHLPGVHSKFQSINVRQAPFSQTISGLLFPFLSAMGSRERGSSISHDSESWDSSASLSEMVCITLWPSALVQVKPYPWTLCSGSSDCRILNLKGSPERASRSLHLCQAYSNCRP